MLFFVDIDCTVSKDVKDLKDVARVLSAVSRRVEELARKGKSKENFVEPIVANDGTEVGEFEWLVDNNDDANVVNSIVRKIEKMIDRVEPEQPSTTKE